MWQHDSHQPIGQVTAAKITKSGIEITAKIAKDIGGEIDRAWSLIKAGLVAGLSIGFKPIEKEAIKGTGGLRFTKWDFLELSAVTIPANAECTIATGNRSTLRSGPRSPQADQFPDSPSAGASDAHPAKPREEQHHESVTIAEQIRRLIAQRVASDGAAWRVKQEAAIGEDGRRTRPNATSSTRSVDTGNHRRGTGKTGAGWNRSRRPVRPVRAVATDERWR